MAEVIRVRPFHYLHVKDLNANVVRVVSGPITFTCKQHEKVILGPERMVVIPPQHYVEVENPILTETKVDPDTGEKIQVPIFGENGQVQLKHGEREIRFFQQPFPLHEGEKCSSPKPLLVVEDLKALKLKALTKFEDREAGDMWLFLGHSTYYPKVEVEIVEPIKAVILKPDQALRVRARHDCKDYLGKKRVTGEEWLVLYQGPYFPNVKEEVISVVSGIVLSDKIGLHVKANATFNTERGLTRKAGSKWLITQEDTELFIPDVNEEVVTQVNLTVLTDNDFCVINDYIDENGVCKRGHRKLIKGPTSFFLKPGESISKTGKSIILEAEHALLLTATEEFIDTTTNTRRKPGDIWYHYGPCEYWLPVEAQIRHRLNAFLKVEPIGLYFFRPHLFFGFLLLLFLAIYFVFWRK